MADSSRPEKRQRSPVIDDGAIAESILENGGDSRPSKKQRLDSRRSLFVRSLPAEANDETLAVFFSQHFPVKHATVVVDPKTHASRGFGFVTLAEAEDAEKARATLDNEQWGGSRIRIDIAKPRHRKGETGSDAQPEHSNGPANGHANSQRLPDKSTKLIVRNLPWSIRNSDQLSHLFRSYGKVLFADLPKTKTGRLNGFGFVTIRGRKNAEKALAEMNGKSVDGRPVAVDWAVEKDVWEKNQTAQQKSLSGKSPSSSKKTPEAAYDDSDGDADADLEAFMQSRGDELEDEEDGDKSDDSAEDSEVEGSGGESHEAAGSVSQSAPPKADNSTTVFVRNLPYTVSEEELRKFFGHFGKVRYARTVMDRTSGRPAGTAFVCFWKEEDAKKCMVGCPKQKPLVSAGKKSLLQDESADPQGLYTIQGRILDVVQAVSRDEVAKVSSHDSAANRDKRRLFLLSEGTLDTRSSLYSLLSATEIKMREASSAQRRKLIQKNPSLHLSLTRLAIRNIPRNVTSRELKELARKAVVEFAKDVKLGRREPLSKEESRRGGKDAKESEHQRKVKQKGVVRQAKVVFESRDGLKTSDEATSARSRGYGFIEYSSHRWALMALRWLNGHQLRNDDGRRQRLIVEFAIENAQVVTRRKTQQQKVAQSTNHGGTPKSSSTGPQVVEKDLGEKKEGRPRKGAGAGKKFFRQKGKKAFKGTGASQGGKGASKGAVKGKQ